MGVALDEDSRAVRLAQARAPLALMNSPNLFHSIILSAFKQNIDCWQSLPFQPLCNEFFGLFTLHRQIE
jgi:hypothetical protein